MAGIGLAPCRSMAAQDIRDLQLWSCQERRALGGRLVFLDMQRREAIERAHDLADGIGGDTGIERRRLEFGVPKQNLDHPNINVLFKQMGRKAVA